MLLKERHLEAASALPQAKLIIGGKDVLSGDAGAHRHVNPSTGAEQADVPLAGPRQVDLAVAAAKQAFGDWKSLPNARRRDLLLKLNELLQREGDRLGSIAALENGATKSIFVAGQMPMIAEWLTYYAGWADKIDGLVPASNSTNFDLVLSEPYGVIATIIPWNGPLGALAMKTAAALIAGNTIVVKPPETTPFLAVRFAELAREAGFPDGVINIVIGGPEAGSALVGHRDVDKITFTGSPQTARVIARLAAENLTPAMYELGGKSANVVFADAPNLDAVVAHAALYPFLYAGQFCVCPSRLIVEDSIYEEVLAKAAAAASAIAIGDPLDPATYMGPLFNKASMDRVLSAVSAATSDGGRVVSGGKRLGDDLADGFFVQPTIVADIDPQSALSQTELFGPVVAVHRFSTEAEALAIANGTEYGLAAYLHTGSVDRALRMSRGLHAGGVYVNSAFPVSNPNLPFGGFGISGYGREGGKAGLDEFLRSKAVSIAVAAG